MTMADNMRQTHTQTSAQRGFRGNQWKPGREGENLCSISCCADCSSLPGFTSFYFPQCFTRLRFSTVEQCLYSILLSILLSILHSILHSTLFILFTVFFSSFFSDSYFVTRISIRCLFFVVVSFLCLCRGLSCPLY